MTKTVLGVIGGSGGPPEVEGIERLARASCARSIAASADGVASSLDANCAAICCARTYACTSRSLRPPPPTPRSPTPGCANAPSELVAVLAWEHVLARELGRPVDGRESARSDRSLWR